MWRFGTGIVLIVASVFVYALETSKGQWTLATDVQKYYRCLPYEWYFVENLAMFIPERGDLVRFGAPEGVDAFDSEYELIKIVVGVEGDTWSIVDDVLYVNERRWGELYLINKIGLVPGALDGEGRVAKGEVYVLGTNPSSLDSRYWGPLKIAEINGRAHAIF